MKEEHEYQLSDLCFDIAKLSREFHSDLVCIIIRCFLLLKGESFVTRLLSFIDSKKPYLIKHEQRQKYKVT